MRKCLYLLMFLLCAEFSQAQVFYVNDNFENFDFNIKQIDEFILRFNLKEFLIEPDQSSSFERDNRILLFDKKYYLDNIDLSNDFLNAIQEQHVTLSFCDSTWYAIAECNVTYQGKKDNLTLILRTEQVKDDIYKWSIIDAKGEMLDLTPKTRSERIRLLPTDNEVNFIALQSVTTTNAQNITLYDVKTHVNDRLSVFNCLVYNKLLRIDNVQTLSYCFTQVSGYKFYVKNFVRESKNAGWLIYEVQKDDTIDESDSSYDSFVESPDKYIMHFYEMLNQYSKNPTDITLAKAILSLFYNQPKANYLFGAKQIFDDLNVYFHSYAPLYAYVAISDYLNSLENILRNRPYLSYDISDIKTIPLSEKSAYVTYKIAVKDNNSILYEYYAKASIQDGLIVDIIPLYQDEM